MVQNESYTPEEIANLLKVSKLTVYDLIKKGEIIAYRVGRQMRVEAEELQRYKNRGQTANTPPKQKEEKYSSFVISGLDTSLDILTRALEGKLLERQVLRSYMGSMDSLIAMYKGQADIVGTHLLDGDTMEYNIPYVRKLLVSQSFVVIRFIQRQVGFYVVEGNEKQIKTWEDLKKPGVVMVNREPGAGARVLLDENLRLAGINRQEVKGYHQELTSHIAVASAVANGRSDVGIGIEQTAKLMPIDFIPLTTESYDLVMLKDMKNTKLMEYVISILQDDYFQEEVRLLGYDIKEMGTIIYEQ